MKALILTDKLANGIGLQRGLIFENLATEIMYFDRENASRIAQESFYGFKVLILFFNEEENLKVALEIVPKGFLKVIVTENFDILKKNWTDVAAMMNRSMNYHAISEGIRNIVFKSSIADMPEKYEAKGIKLDLVRRVVMYDGKKKQLTNKIYNLLYFLMRNPDKLLNKITILEHVWDINAIGMTNTVDVHISKLRKIFGELNIDRNLIKTIPCSGYIFGE